MDLVRIGIVGFGRIGAEHAGWLTSARDIHAVAVADATPARQELARSRGLRVVDQIDQLLTDNEIDAVLVSTPTAMHFDHAMAALVAGKHVMVEKPFALNLAQAQQLVDEAGKQSRTLSIFHNRRWDLDYQTIKQAIASGVFGKIINIESRLGQFASCVGPAAREYRPNWRNEASFGGGALFDWGSHFVDQLIYLMPDAKPLRVFAQLRGNVWSTDCDDFARVCLDFDNGAAAMMEMNTTTTKPGPRWHIDGTNGSANSPYSLDFDVKKWAELDFTDVDGMSRRLPVANAGLNETEIWEKFAQAIRGEGQPAVTAASVLPTMAILDAARQSSKTGKAVEL